ncbi:MAG: queuosine precursor transporter [Alphaproteobacteria bacterium]|nr:queuosine precursor transporter [Alphaproteobacteria bacterium]
MTSPAAGAVSQRFLVVVALFVTCLVVANIVAVKLVAIGGLIVPAGVVVFPVTYILGDVLTEVYGYSRARRAIWLGFLCNLLAVAAIVVAGALPPADFWDGQPAFERILGQAPRLLAASFVAYLVGEFVNAYVLARLKVAMEGRMLWVRTIASTLIGQLFDSAVFVALAFAGVMPPSLMAAAILTQWLFKSAYEAAATPVTYAVVGWLKRAEGIDVYDRRTRFNPLALSD